MPDPLPPSDDELISAYLDGEASPDEIARVEASPELLAQVEALRAVATQVAGDPDPTTIDPAQRDAHIAAALEASGTAANVTSLAPARSRPWYRQPVAAVAAALLAVVIAVPLLANLGDDDADRDVATSASDDEAADGGDAGDPDAAGATGETSARSAIADAGELEADELADAATSDDGGDGAAAEEAEGLTAADAFVPERLRPSATVIAFESVDAVVIAFDELDDLDAADATAEAAAPPAEQVLPEDGATSERIEACGLGFEDVFFVATVDDVGEVLVGTIAGDTVVVVVDDGCERLFPDE